MRAVVFAVLIASSALLTPAANSQGAQDAAATDCDKYAAHPGDPARKAAGIAFEKINTDLAIPACEAAVRQYPDSPRLVFQLGRAYSKNNNFVAALIQYRKAAERGYPPAQYGLALAYANGQGVSQDYAQAIGWYRTSAEQGYAPAQYGLGVAYANGEGVPKNYVQAVGWFRTSAEQGYALAQYNLGVAYSNGQGVSQDYAAARTWYRKAGDQGNVYAQVNLAFMYEQGQGGPQDLTAAAMWYRKAAEQGNELAKNKLTERALLLLIKTPKFKAAFARAEICLHDTMLRNLEQGNAPPQFAAGTAWLVKNAVSVCEGPFSEFIAESKSVSDPRGYSHKLLTSIASGQIMHVISEKNNRITNRMMNDIENRLEECKFLLKC